MLERSRLVWLLLAAKTRLLGEGFEARHPATLDASPHVQRFTTRSLRRLLEHHGFQVDDLTGSVLIAGPFSHLLFSGIEPLTRVNCWLGERFPRVAVGFYARCRVAPALEPNAFPGRVAETDMLRLIVQGRLHTLPSGPLEIRCHDLQLALGRDVVDLSLSLRRRSWTWSDEQGSSAPPAGMFRAAAALLREAIWASPVGYLRHSRRIRQIERAGTAQQRARSLDRALFLRSDHSFGVVAGGSVGHLAGVIRGFRRHRVDVQVVSTDYLAGVPQQEQFHLIRPEYGRSRNFSELVRLNYNEQLIAAIEQRWPEWRPDFVYHRYSTFNYAGPYLRMRYAVPYVCEYNGPLVWVQRHWESRRLVWEGLAERVERLNLQTADLVVVVSRALVDAAVSRGADPDRVLVNPNGVDPSQYAPDVSGAAVRERYGLEGALVVGFIGTIAHWHGVESLIEAAAELYSRRDAACERLRFLIIGDGSRMAAVREQIRHAGLADRVTLTGLVPQEEGPAHMAACDILASPHVPNPDGSEFFGSPTKIFEYMAMGRAIVASNLGQIGEVLENGETALLVPPAEPHALAEAIRVLAADPALRARLGANARRIALRQYTWDAHSRRILDALAERVCEPVEARTVCSA